MYTPDASWRENGGNQVLTNCNLGLMNYVCLENSSFMNFPSIWHLVPGDAEMGAWADGSIRKI